MALYTDDSRERVRDAVDMVDLVKAKTELRRAGSNEMQGLCPFHEERSPSFGVDPVKKVFHCFGCGEGGDVFDFVIKTEGVDFPAALELLADRYGVTLERTEEDPRAAERRRHRERLYELLGRTADYYARYLWESAEAGGAREYLASRGLEEETLRAFRIGYAPSAWDHILLRSRRAGYDESELLAAGLVRRAQKSRNQVYDWFRERITFPLTDLRGRVVGFGARAMRDEQGAKYVNSPDGTLYHKGKHLFGADRARAQAAKAAEVIVVEGYTDVLAMHQAGLANAVGLMGTSMTEEQVAEAARLAPRVLLALDADASGQEAIARAAGVASKRSLELRVVGLPPGSDPADLVRAEGADALGERFAQSVPIARFRVDRLLAAADTATADGRDRAMAALREVLGALPPSALREELVRLVAGRLELSEQLVSSLAAAPGGGGGGDRAAAPRRVALDSREQAERTFLALCIALPEPGRETLRSVDLDAHFANPLVRRAAAHLREHLAAPLDGVDQSDGELSGLLAELSVRAAREPADRDTLEIQSLQLETARLEREIVSARSQGRLDVQDLAVRRGEVKAALDNAMDRAMDSPGG